VLNIFRISMHMCRGSISINISENVKIPNLCVEHKYLDMTQNLLFHDLKEWDVVPTGYSLNTHMFIFGWHPLVKYVSLWVIRHFIPLEVYFKTSSEHSDWNFRCVLNIFHKHIEWFSTCFANVLLRYLIVLRRISTSMVLNCIKK